MYITSFGTDPLVALQSGDRSIVNETVDISVGNFYEVLPLTYSARGTTVVNANGPLVSVLFVDVPTCGSCGTKSDGCQRVAAVSDDGFIYVSEDGGVTWAVITQPADVLAATLAAPIATISYRGDILVFEASGKIWRADADDVFDDTVGTWDTTTLSGITVADAINYANDIVVVVGTAGVIQYFESFGETATVAEDGGLVAGNLVKVAAGADGNFVVGAVTGEMLYSEDGKIWYLTTGIPSATEITSLMVKSASSWIAGFTGGELFCTDNTGESFTQIKYPGYTAGYGAIAGLALATNHVAYMVQGTRVLRSIDGGVNWTVQPDSRQVMPTVTAFSAVAACGYDPNRVIAAGEGSVATTGGIVLGVE